ncbi:MAG: acyltransferase [Phocaeicola sp.]
MKLKSKNEIGWLDWLRVCACFLVVLAHVCDHFVANFDNNIAEFMAGVAWGSFYRPCVPLFTLMTGYLLLPTLLDMGTFYSKKMKRIFIPFIFWAIVSPILFFAYFQLGANSGSPAINLAEHTFPEMINRLLFSILNFNYATIPLWYIYMLIGLYLFIPILSPFLRNASRKELHILLGLWVFTLIIPYIQMVAPSLGYVGIYGNMNLFGQCDWNPYGTFYYLSGFMGYLVLGYYFKKYPLQISWGKFASIALPCYALGYAITYFGFLKMQELFPGDYSKLEVVWYFCSVNVLLMTAPIFVLFQKLNWKGTALVRKVASVSFGIFLCHFFFVQFSYDLIYPILPFTPYLQIPIIAIAAFLLSFLVVYLFSLVKWGRKVVE